MADTIIENLITRLSFEVDQSILDNFERFLGKASKGLLALVTAAASAAATITVLSSKVADANTQLLRLSNRTNIGVETIQELGFAAQVSGGSVESMNSTLESLTVIASEAARGMGGGVEVFGMLGVSVVDASNNLKTADVLLSDVADAISRLQSQAMRLEFAQRLGISPDLLNLIQKGSAELSKLREEARSLGIVVDKEAIAASERFTVALTKLFAMFRNRTLLSSFVARLAPVIEQFTAWVVVNQDLIRQKIDRVIEIIIRTLRGMWNITLRVVSVVNALAQAMGGWRNAILLVTGAVITLNASALLIPALWTAAGVALFLVLEDIIKFAQGAESQIGVLADRFPVLDKSLRGILWVLGKVAEGWILIFEEGPGLIKDLIGWLNQLKTTLVDDLTKPIRVLLGPVFDFIGTQVGAELQRQREFNAQFQPSPTGGGVTNNASTRNVTINVNGGDTDKIKQVIRDELGDQYSSAQSNLSSQVER